MTPQAQHAARTANEQTYRVGHDIDLSFELADYAESEEAEDERLEAEGRREMYETLFGGWEV